MQKKFLILWLSLGSLMVSAQSEDITSIPAKKKHQIYLGIEGGSRSFETKSRDYEFIRAEAVYYFGYHNNYSQLSWLTYAPFVALKAEYRSHNDKFWLSTGLRYSSIKTIMDSYSDYANNTDYFYVMLNQNQQETYYYRINEIRETNQYMGVPFEIRYSPFKPRFFRLYFKLAIDLNFKLANKREIEFFDPAMKIHEKEIAGLFDQPGSFYAGGDLGVGIQLGRQNKPNFRFEGDFPSFVFTPEAFGLANNTFGGGVRISFIYPLKTK
jgi:hypothetical protein